MKKRAIVCIGEEPDGNARMIRQGESQRGSPYWCLGGLMEQKSNTRIAREVVDEV